MTDTNTPDQDTDPGQAHKQPSDARVILGPLVKYAAMGFVLVSIIVTTAVMLDRQFNTIDQEVAALQAELERAQEQIEAPGVDSADTVAESEVAEPAANTGTLPQAAPVAIDPAPLQQGQIDTADTAAGRQPEVAAVKAAVDNQPEPAMLETPAAANEAVAEVPGPAVEPRSEQVADSAVSTPAGAVFFDHGMDEFIADRNTYLQERDRLYLERLRDSRERQLELMRENLARHEQKILEMEQRYQELYDIRAADMKEMQERREHFLSDRI